MHLEPFEMMESVCERDTICQKNVYSTKGYLFCKEMVIMSNAGEFPWS